MFEQFLHRWTAAWIRFVDRLPLSDQGIETELPAGAFVVSPNRPGSVIPPVSPPASDQPGSQ